MNTKFKFTSSVLSHSLALYVSSLLSLPFRIPRKATRAFFIVWKFPNLLLLPWKFSVSISLSLSHSPGAIFSEEQKDTSIELAFKYAVYKINKDRSILPKTTLVYDIQYVPDSTDSFRTSKKVCKQIENGVTAIFGEQNNFNFTIDNSILKFDFSLLKKQTTQ